MIRSRPWSIRRWAPLAFLVAFCGPAPARGQEDQAEREVFADAPALSNIKIDGDLSDWPPAMPRYPINNLRAMPQQYGMGGLDDADLSTSPDFSAAFSAGYDPKLQVIYLAIIVRDDKLVAGNKGAFDTDSVEIFIDGQHSKTKIPYPDGDWDVSMTADKMPALQYVGIPGPGPAYGDKKSKDSFRLMYGDITKTKTKMSYSRKGDVTTYEWAIQPFDHYPDKPTRLEPGKKLGFDLAIVDRDVPRAGELAGVEDEELRPAWIIWGSLPQYFKGFDAGSLGELVLGKAP